MDVYRNHELPVTVFRPRTALSLLVLTSLAACHGAPVLTVSIGTPLHLETQLGAASIASHLASGPSSHLEWDLATSAHGWSVARPWNGAFKPALLTTTQGGLRVTLEDGMRDEEGFLVGGIYTDVPGLEWRDVVVRARSAGIDQIQVGVNLKAINGTSLERKSLAPDPFVSLVSGARLVRDELVSYQLSAQVLGETRRQPWAQLGLWFRARHPGSIDIMTVGTTSSQGQLDREAVGVTPVSLEGRWRLAVFSHTPSSIRYRLKLPPAAARLSLSLGIVRPDVSVDFRVSIRTGDRAVGTLLNEIHQGSEGWIDRSVDLSPYSGQTFELEFASTSTGAMSALALWGAPTVTLKGPPPRRPNVILYVMDGVGAEYLDAYGFQLTTAPYIAGLAAEGALFERAYSTSSWTRPSTTSFMTSLFPSVLGMRSRSDSIPLGATTMAERFHAAGYQTAVFTSNPWAASSSGLERGVDAVRETAVRNGFTSSAELNDDFWKWRATFDGQPFWVHFQPTDAHADSSSTVVPPFDRLFRRPARHRRSVAAGQAPYFQAIAHNDAVLREFIERLVRAGDWQNTLLVVTADHSIAATGFELLEPSVAKMPWRPVSQPSISRVPLIVIWPGHIRPVRYGNGPVSLIDVLPTVLDLTGISLDGVMQGESLAGVLLQDSVWRQRPVFIESFEGTQSTFDVIIDEWAVSTRIGTDEGGRQTGPWASMLFDLRHDLRCEVPRNVARPDLVAKYVGVIQQHWRANQQLAKRFSHQTAVGMTPEELERLRSLGYIR